MLLIQVVLKIGLTNGLNPIQPEKCVYMHSYISYVCVNSTTYIQVIISPCDLISLPTNETMSSVEILQTAHQFPSQVFHQGGGSTLPLVILNAPRLPYLLLGVFRQVCMYRTCTVHTWQPLTNLELTSHIWHYGTLCDHAHMYDNSPLFCHRGLCQSFVF